MATQRQHRTSLKVRLTTEFAARAIAIDGKRTIYFDNQLPGFGLYVTEGGAKSWFLKYRFKGRRRQATIANVAAMPAHLARKRAAAMQIQIHGGVDPLDTREEERSSQTVAEFWVSYRDDAESRWKVRTRDENDRLWKRDVVTVFGRCPLESLGRGEIGTWHRSMKATPTKANRALAILRSMLGKAVEWDILSSNPASRVKPFPERSRERFLSSEEFSAIWEAIAIEERLGGRRSVERVQAKGDRRKAPEKESRGISPYAAGLLRLLILTGARLREIMHARWEWVLWKERCIALPDHATKSGRKRLPLSRPAIEELQRLQAIRLSPWIIAGYREDRPMYDATGPWNRVRERAHAVLNERRKKADVPLLAENPFDDLRIHDLRHSFASVMVASGRGLPIVGKALGHSQSRTTERYSHLAADPVLEAVDEAGAIILEAVGRPHAVVEEIGKH